MGSGASSALLADLQGASVEELRQGLSSLSEENRAKVVAVVASLASDEVTKAMPILILRLSAEPLSLEVSPQDALRNIKGLIEESLGIPSRKQKLILGKKVLEDDLKSIEECGIAEGASLMLLVVEGFSENAYLTKHESTGEIILLQEGDEGWKEQTVNISMDKWVPAPGEKDVGGAEVQNIAKESEGATVFATSFRNPEYHERLKNVIRLGAKFGDPRYTPGGDNSFIFTEFYRFRDAPGATDADQEHNLYVDFGKDVIISRVGTMCYRDRCIEEIQISSSEDSDRTTTNWLVWGGSTGGLDEGGVVYYDHDPIRVRLLRFSVYSSSLGARIGPVFAYGIPA